MLAPLIVLALAAGPSAADRVQIFRAAGFHLHAGQWKSDECNDPGKQDVPSEIKPLGDLNRDGRPEVLVRETGTYCYGNTGEGFALLSKSANGRWTKLYQSQGIAEFLKTRANGWPEVEVGGPGFCFPILRFNGKAYVYHRDGYGGKPCRR